MAFAYRLGAKNRMFWQSCEHLSLIASPQKKYFGSIVRQALLLPRVNQWHDLKVNASLRTNLSGQVNCFAATQRHYGIFFWGCLQSPKKPLVKNEIEQLEKDTSHLVSHIQLIALKQGVEWAENDVDYNIADNQIAQQLVRAAGASIDVLKQRVIVALDRQGSGPLGLVAYNQHHMLALAVRPDKQRTGLGRYLVGMMIHRYLQQFQGQYQLSFHVMRTNQKAINFYTDKIGADIIDAAPEREMLDFSIDFPYTVKVKLLHGVLLHQSSSLSGSLQRC